MAMSTTRGISPHLDEPQSASWQPPLPTSPSDSPSHSHFNSPSSSSFLPTAAPVRPHSHIRYTSTISSATRRTSSEEASSSQQLHQPLLSPRRRRRRKMNSKDGKMSTFWKDEPMTRIGARGVTTNTTRSSSRRHLLRILNFALELILGIWSVYCTVRYFIAYAKSFNTVVPGSQSLALILGICSALCVTFVLAASLISTSSHFLREEGVPGKYVDILRVALRCMAALLVITPAIASFVLVFVWKARPRSCHLDVDVVWVDEDSSYHDSCHSAPWAVWLGMSIVRLVLTLTLAVMYIYVVVCERHNYHHPNINTNSVDRPLCHRTDLSNSTYRSSSFTTSLGASAAQYTTPPGGLSRHASSPSAVAVGGAGGQHARFVDSDPDGLEAVSPTPIPPGLVPGCADAAVETIDSTDDPEQQQPPPPPPPPVLTSSQPMIDEQQLSMFAERFRNIVAQITRETEDGLDLARSDRSGNGNDNMNRSHSRRGNQFHPTLPPANSVSAVPPHPFSSAYYAEDETTPEYEPTHAHDSSGSDDEDEDGYGRYYYDQYGREILHTNPEQEHVRVLGSYIRRMSTIESLGSREQAASPLGSGRNSIRSIGLASLASMSTAATRPPTRNAMSEYNSGSEGPSRANSLSHKATHIINGLGSGSTPPSPIVAGPPVPNMPIVSETGELLSRSSQRSRSGSNPTTSSTTSGSDSASFKSVGTSPTLSIPPPRPLPTVPTSNPSPIPEDPSAEI